MFVIDRRDACCCHACNQANPESTAPQHYRNVIWQWVLRKAPTAKVRRLMKSIGIRRQSTDCTSCVYPSGLFMRRSIVFLALAAALAFPAAAQPISSQRFDAASAYREPPGELTLEAALELVLSTNHSLSAARNLAASSAGAVTQAGVLPNPTVGFEVEDTNRKATRTTTGSLSMPIELGGKRRARMATAELGGRMALSDLEVTRADIKSQTIAAFFDVLIAQEQVALAKSALDLSQSATRVANRRVQAGKVAPLEESRAQVEQANAELELNESEVGLTLARRTLSALWGNPRPAFSAARGDLNALPSRPALDDLISALERSPQLESARLAVEKSQSQIQLERSKRYPDLTVSVGVMRDQELGRNQPTVGVSIPLPLFDRNQGNLYEASMLAYKSQDDYRGMRLQLETELQAAASQFDLSRDAAQKLNTLILPTARQSFDTAQRGFEAGKFSFTEVLDAQRSLSQARARYLTVLSTTYQAVARIDRILGR
ncbi:TolC family protein [Schauerella aestuarii]|uniref:TolC family protein n=1 Tax=Schauerella aestuarii TaxID=2511204 RepID=UPI002E2ADB46|nr:TolC family protein [Achromobacter aestuarii]